MAVFLKQLTETITMYWRTGGSYVNGRWVDGPEGSSEIVASVQRLELREREMLPETYRARQTIKMYTEIDSLQVMIDNRPTLVEAAEFEWKGNRYTMIGSEEWDYLIPHWKITAVAK